MSRRMKLPKDPGLLRVTDVARYLKIMPCTVNAWIARGKLTGVTIGTDRSGKPVIRVTQSSVEALIQ